MKCSCGLYDGYVFAVAAAAAVSGDAVVGASLNDGDNGINVNDDIVVGITMGMIVAVSVVVPTLMPMLVIPWCWWS